MVFTPHVSRDVSQISIHANHEDTSPPFISITKIVFCSILIIYLQMKICTQQMAENFIHRLQQKENRAYMELYDHYFAKLHRFARSFVFDGEVAKDIVQNALIKLYENISQLESAVNIGAYLCVTVRNSCLNYLRDQGVKDRHKILYLQAVEQAETLEWLDDEELIKNIKKIITELPEKYRNICELRFYYNLKYSEIAKRLGISENVAKVQIHRAIQKIKEALANNNEHIIGILMFIFPILSLAEPSPLNRE